MAAFADMVIHHLANAPRFAFAIRPVYIIHHSAENCSISHLPTNQPRFNFGTTQKFFQFFHQQSFHFINKIGTLIVKNFSIIESFHLLMLSIPKRRIHYRKQAYKR